MYKRIPLVLVLVFGLLAVGFTVSDAGQGTKEKDKDKEHHHHHAMFDKCAVACNDCQRMCDSCAAHCARLLAEGKKEHHKSLRTCQDCATVCSAAANIVARGGPFSGIICKACAESCARCGTECEKFPDDAHMKKCAEECRKCEKVCREMLTHLPPAAVTTPITKKAD